MSDEEFIKKREIAINDKGFPKLDIPYSKNNEINKKLYTKITKRRKNGYA